MARVNASLSSTSSSSSSSGFCAARNFNLKSIIFFVVHSVGMHHESSNACVQSVSNDETDASDSLFYLRWSIVQLFLKQYLAKGVDGNLLR